MDNRTRLTNSYENGNLKLESEWFSNDDSLVEPKLGIKKTFTENKKLESEARMIYDKDRNLKFRIQKLYDENGKVKKIEETRFSRTIITKTTKPLARVQSFTEKEAIKTQQRSQSSNLEASTQ